MTPINGKHWQAPGGTEHPRCRVTQSVQLENWPPVSDARNSVGLFLAVRVGLHDARTLWAGESQQVKEGDRQDEWLVHLQNLRGGRRRARGSIPRSRSSSTRF